jgi:hypothetical protein
VLFEAPLEAEDVVVCDRSGADDTQTSARLAESGRGPGLPAPSHTTGHAGPHPAVHQANRRRRQL